MIVRVECYAGHRGEATPRRLLLDHRQVELIELLDCWLAPDRYFKLRGAGGAGRRSLARVKRRRSPASPARTRVWSPA